MSLIGEAINAAFEHGKSAQRLEDAQIDEAHDSMNSQTAIAQVMDALTPDQKDLN